MAGAESRAGGPLTEYPATLSRDAKFLFTCCGAAVRVYSVHTGSLIQTLEGHTAGVSGACSFPDDAQHVYSFSLDGTIRKWAWEAGKLLQTYDVGFPIDAWVRVAGDAKAFYVATTKRVNKKVMTQEGDEKVQKRPGKVGRVEITGEGSTFTQLFEVSKIANFAAGKEWIAVSNKKKLTLYHVATKATRVFRHPREVTALAFHPTEDYLITGEVNGSISRWQSLSVHERDEPIATNYHWHAHACHAVAFTPDGAYVLSGGEELETGKKTFVPRIGRGPITGICVANDSSIYAVSLQDNGIHIINAFSMKQDQLIQGISNALLPIDWRPLVGFVQDPRTNCIVTNTYPGFASLQVYDVLRDAHVGDFEVEPQSVAIKGKAYEMRVEHIAFNADGSACATVDRYYSAYGSSAPCALKFWSRNSGQTFSFSLNSRTDAAHKAPITAIAYHPHMVVSAGQDRKFKVWVRIVRDKTRESNPTATPAYSWQCRSVGTYHNLNPEAVAFSTDGSLLAVSYGPVVTLWDPALNMLKHTLTQPHSEDPVRRVAFIPHSPYLVGHTDFDLVVWNLLTGGVWWSYRLHATALAVDTRTARFAVAAAADAHNADFLLVFNAADPKPVRITRFASGARLRELAWLADASAQSSALVYATSDRVFYVARDKPSLEAARSSLPVVSAATPSLLAQLVPELQAAEREAEAAHASLVPLVAQDCHPLPGLEDVPSHALPPVQDLFDLFFDRMMALRTDATVHADGGAEVTMSDVSKQSTKAPLYSVGSEAEAKRVPTTQAAPKSEATLEEDAEAGDREAEEAEEEEELFDFDEMVAFIKQMRIGGGDGNGDAADAASVPSPTKSKKPKKKADEDSEAHTPAATDSHAGEAHASTKSKGKRDAAAEATEPQAPSTPAKSRRNNAAAAAPAASAEEASAPPRKTPRRKGKGGEEEAEEAAASEAEAAAVVATEPKTPRAKNGKEAAAAAAAAAVEAKTPRRRAKGDDEGAAVEAKTPAAHAKGTNKAAASEKDAAEAKTPRRRGRAAAALDDESQQTDEQQGGPRRSTRHAGHAAE